MNGTKNFYPGTGTTLCPHCNTRFKIAVAQLEAHHGMVRCGSCLKAFDANVSYIPDTPDPQLELLILDSPIAPTEDPSVAKTTPEIIETGAVEENASIKEASSAETLSIAEETRKETVPTEIAQDNLLDFSQPAAAAVEPGVEESTTEQPPSNLDVLQPETLAEQVAIVQDGKGGEPRTGYRSLNWVIASALLILLLCMQAAYFFRIELAAHTPGLKPALTSYGKLFGGSVPLPQDASLMSIESSDLETDPAHENRIILNVLLRNRATYAQAFPNLELTLNDSQDRPLARRTFMPKDYLPPVESEKTGLQANHELNIKLPLGITDLKPTGYRLALHYPRP